MRADLRSAPRARDGVPVPVPGERWALLLDVDGTLLEFAARPTDVVADDDLQQLLGVLCDRCDGALALVTGRSIADVDRVYFPRVFPAAGQHGLERRDAAGRVRRYDGLPDGWRAALTQLRAFERAHPGVLLEDKGASVTLHYRGAPAAAAAAEALVAAVAAELGPQFESLPGAMVVEFRPAGRDKGTAIDDFLGEPPFAGRVPVFVGDDRSDELGFRLVNRRGGHTVKVGEGESAATWRLPNAMHVRCWLAQVAEAFA